MQVLSRYNNKILFVDYEFTVKDIIRGIQGKRNVPVNRVLGMEERLRTEITRFGTEVYILSPPPVLPVNWIKSRNAHRIMLYLNAGIIRQSIRKSAKMLGIKKPILVNGYNPFFGLPLAGSLEEELNIYFCYDEINGDPFYSFHGPHVEYQYMKKCDGVLTTSDGLYSSKSKYHVKCGVVKNGVDFELFNSVAGYRKPEKGKIVGYAGSVDERFDIESVEHAVKNLPDHKFNFVGRITNQSAKIILEKYPNVQFSGARKPEIVPDFIKEMDVCIIPYIKNDVTRGVYPLKVNEYLAAGKPVVMTDFARISELENYITVAHSREQFLEGILHELMTDDELKRKDRIEVARKNSWENKAEEFSAFVEILRESKLLVK
jgi:glycosyltransferase involved in cell wall biosynthesis